MNYIEEVIERYPALSLCGDSIRKAADIMVDCYRNKGKILVCGNGGSAADADHIVGELMKGFLSLRKLTDKDRTVLKNDALADSLQLGLPAISLCAQSGLISAFSNDCSWDSVYAQQVYAYSKNSPCDVLIALTTSGNSKNVVLAAETARALGIKVIGITGSSGGKLAGISDCCICLPEKETYKIQELTLPVYHALCAETEAVLFNF